MIITLATRTRYDGIIIRCRLIKSSNLCIRCVVLTGMVVKRIIGQNFEAEDFYNYRPSEWNMSGLLERFRKTDPETAIWGPSNPEALNHQRLVLLREINKQPWLHHLVPTLQKMDDFSTGIESEPRPPMDFGGGVALSMISSALLGINNAVASIRNKDTKDKIDFVESRMGKRAERKAEYEIKLSDWTKRVDKQRDIIAQLQQNVDVLTELERLASSSSETPQIMETSRLRTRILTPFTMMVPMDGQIVEIMQPVLPVDKVKKRPNSRFLTERKLSQVELDFSDSFEGRGSGIFSVKYLGTTRPVGSGNYRRLLKHGDDVMPGIHINKAMKVRVPTQTRHGIQHMESTAGEVSTEQLCYELHLRIREACPGIYIHPANIKAAMLMVKNLGSESNFAYELEDLFNTTNANEENWDALSGASGTILLNIAFNRFQIPNSIIRQRFNQILSLKDRGSIPHFALLKRLVLSISLSKDEWSEITSAIDTQPDLFTSIASEIIDPREEELMRTITGPATGLGQAFYPALIGEREYELYEPVTIESILRVLTHPKFIRGLTKNIDDLDGIIEQIGYRAGEEPVVNLKLVELVLAANIAGKKLALELANDKQLFEKLEEIGAANTLYRMLPSDIVDAIVAEKLPHSNRNNTLPPGNYQLEDLDYE